MSFAGFHPLVRQWFTTEVGQPTAAQLKGWDYIGQGRHTLIAAPTGSGKTLAAFLNAIDALFREGTEHALPDEVRAIYVSPLKALSADIHKNLAEPRQAVMRLAERAGTRAPNITSAVRTGDTTQSERAAMLRTPPHILITTPESLYLLLTAERSRHMLRTVRTVIVDEIHAVIGSRRGAHLALSLERLEEIADRPFIRLGLSATQRPLEDVARFLVGNRAGAQPSCAIVDEGHRRRMDLGVEIPRSALDAVMSQDVWNEYYDRLAALVAEHKTTLIFVNTRRLAERMARHLSERIGEDQVTAHHGSLSKEIRLDAEARLKTGRLRALIATASLELGIDIGHVDLVCQIGSPHRIATLLQRVGRSGHSVSGTPKGRIFPASRDDLFECAALLRAIRHGELDAIVQQDAPLDVLAQQIVAESAARAYGEDELFALVRRAWPYRDLTRADFDAVVRMLAEGFATRRGRRAALIHRDEIHGVVRGRRGSRLLAQTSGGAIPEVADYRVVLEPDDTFIGTLNEDFAIESMGGDVFQLGNSSWRVLQVGGGTVRVADAKGTPPNMPFWLGEAPARSDELSRAVSDLRAEIDRRLAEADVESACAWLSEETGLARCAAEQVTTYFAEGRRALGVIPTQETLVLERFFDESGGMQLVLHAPFGSRINKAWGLALRKRFCRQFNFELQAAATEDAILLSLGPQHSFPLADVFRYLHPNTTRDVLVQAFLDAPVFQTRWRWNTTISLAVPRRRGGRKLAPQLQRMLADDLMAAVFPDAAACLENIPGDRQIPDHPLVTQTVRDCLQEAMDFEGLARILGRVHDGDVRLVARDTPEPSCFAHEILNAKPYAFLDDAPLEERRAHAVQSRRAGEPARGDLGQLDAGAIDRVRDEARPQPRDPDELHDALLTAGYLTSREIGAMPLDLFDRLTTGGRASVATIDGAAPMAVAAERIPEILAIAPEVSLDPYVEPPPSRTSRAWSRAEALIEIVRGRLTITGPVTAATLAAPLGVPESEIEAALLALEADGVVLRGFFSPLTSDGGAPIADPGTRSGSVEWCDRSLLARIHRYTLNRLRAEIEPVSPADFMRFLFSWQSVALPSRRSSIDGLRDIITTLDGFELSASAWERAVLPARMDRYDPQLLDMLCLAGEVGWARLSIPPPDPLTPPRLAPATPVALFVRSHADAWQRLRLAEHDGPPPAPTLNVEAALVLQTLHARGASFFNDLVEACALEAGTVESAISALVAAGLASSDGFSGLRALIVAARGTGTVRDRRSNFSGRWTALGSRSTTAATDEDVETLARTLLRRYGIVFRRVLAREPASVPWRVVSRVYRRLEARGEIRGGRFVSGMSGEQFALPDAVERLREIRRARADEPIVTISAADPLNLTGILTAGERIRSSGRTSIAYHRGVAVAVREHDFVRQLAPIDSAVLRDVTRALGRRFNPIAAVHASALPVAE